MKRHILRYALPLAAMSLLTATGYAQTVAGAAGGGGPFAGFLNWVQGNVLQSLGILVIVCLGAALLFARMHALSMIAFGVAGVWVMTNAPSIYTAIVGGG